MAAKSRLQPIETDGVLQAPRRRSRPRVARPTDATLESPAAQLQVQLSQAWLESPEVGERWSRQRRLLFLAVTSASLWGVIGYAIHALVAPGR